MSLSKYPNQFDLFETKKDAQFDGDPNGDVVMADDVNALQDAISSIETALGINPQGNKLTVGERITLLEGSSSLRVPSFLIYLGNPAKVNNSDTTLEAAMWFAKFDHVVLGNSAMDPSDPDHASTIEVINYIRSSKDIKFYGYIDCGVNTFNLSISEIQNQIIQWMDLDVAGIYCANFGYEDRVTRDRQNQILDSIHQYGLVAVLDTVDPEQAFTNIYHETMNPNWVEPHIEEGDIFHYSQFALDSSRNPIYEPSPIGTVQTLIKLYDYRVNKGIKVFATPVIQSNVDATTAQAYYEYAHTVAIVTSMDAMYPATEGYAELTNFVPVYQWMPITGNWYMSSPRIEYDFMTGIAVRELPFGKITLDFNLHTYKYEGIYIPFELLKIATNSIDGKYFKDSTIEDSKIKTYSGQRLIGAINADTSTDTIDISKISVFGYDDLSGSIPTDALKVNVIDAINAYIGTATINEAYIGDLHAGKITAGTIEADRISASVVDALNLYAQNAEIGHAVIDSAVIGDLSADKITAGDITAERIQAGVVDAINLSAKQGYIQNLNADNITAGNIKADRIQAEVINAINMYAENMVVGSAVINSATVGELSAGHIQASVIEAINISSDTATIKSAVIGDLSVDNMKAAVISAINATIETAKIGEAVIDDLSASKITAGTIDADRINGSVITAINASIEQAQIGNAKIGNLNADKITAGDIAAERIQVGVVDALNLHAQNMTVDSAKIDVATIGDLTANHIKGAVVEAINLNATNATIDAAKIGSLTADNIKASVIAAVNASIENAEIDQAKIGNLSATKITTGDLNADRIKSSVITAINGSFENITIDSGKIGSLEVTNLQAAVISAVNASIENAKIDAAAIGSLKAENIQAEIIKAINASIETATIDAAQIGTLTADHIKGAVIEAINAKFTNTTIDNAVIGQLGVDNMKATVIEAINTYTGVATIGEGKIGNLSAGKITTGDIAAERMTTNAINAINADLTNATIDAAQIGSLKAENIEAEVIKAINASIENVTIANGKIGQLSVDNLKAAVISAINASIESAKIDAAQIGSLKAENIQAEIIKAINASIETATIDAAQIGTLKAENMQAEILKAINASIETAKIGEAQIGDLSASKIVAGDIAAERLTSNVVAAINAEIQTAQINQAKIGDLNANKITAGDIDANRLKANIVTAINAYAQTMTADSAKIDSAAMGTLSASHIQAAVISAINASVENIKINNAKIDVLTADHIKATVIDAINTTTQTAVIGEGKIGNLSAGKITSGDIATDRLKANAISAVNADLSQATINAAKIGSLKAENIQAEIVKAINASIETANIDGAKIGTLEVDSMTAAVIAAVNASIESATINAARIGSLKAENIQAEIIKAINASVESITIGSGKIGSLDADNIKASVITAINASIESATINAARIGVLEAANIKAGSIDATKINVAGLRADQITSGYISAQRINTDTIKSNMIAANQILTEHMQAGSIKGDRIEAGTLNADRLIAGTLDASFIKAGTITSELIAAGGVTARNIAAGSITADAIQAGSISANHISTQGLDAQAIQVYNGKTGEVLIGSGFLRVDGLDVGVVQSDNLIANGAFMTSSSAYGYLRDNPDGEAILGGKSTAPGGHELWKINISDGTVYPIDLGAKKPVDVAIDTDGTFAYVSMQGDDTLVQVDLANNTRTGLTLPMGKGPGRVYFNGDTLMDMKHFMVLGTDPEDVNIPDALFIVDAPPTSIDQALYVHHEVPLGNMPYDVVTTNHHVTYVTLADQGDIAVLEMSNPNSMNWKPIRNIPIAAYMTDNYHGGLPGNVGLNEVTGGDSAAQYDTNMEEMNMPGHVHGGYGTTDGSLLTYEPHGLSLSYDPELLYVADYANGHLVIVDVNGKAPYNALTGSRQQGNLGTMGYPMGMGPNKPENPPTTIPPTAPTVDGDAGSSMGGMVMSVESTDEPVFEATMDGMDMGGSTEVTNGAGRTFTKDPLQHTTHYVWYRIPVGDSPEFVTRGNGYIFVTVEGTGKVAVIKEQDIIDNITYDRWYYTNYDEFTAMRDLPTWSVTQIDVGSKPSHMQYCTQTKRLFVTINGTNQVAIIDTSMIDPMNPNASVIQRVNVGANPKGIAIDKNGEYMYVVNHGGTGNLSFVYPNGSYIGDPYVGLEGGVEYQGADGWVPNRSSWAYKGNDVAAGSSIEFHINEPFLNEGGYVKLTGYNDGDDAQWAYVEQDIVNVVNYSNGNNIQHITDEVLRANDTFTLFTPEYPWLADPGVTNVRIRGIAKNETLTRGADNLTFTPANKWVEEPQPPTFIKSLADGTQVVMHESTYTVTYPSTPSGTAKVVFNSQIEAGSNIIAVSYYWWKDAAGYTVEYNTGAYIRFNLGVVASDEWVTADYTHKYNMWFKPHNGSIAIAVEQGSTDNFYTKFEIDEFVPKFITYDNQQTESFTYSPIARAGTNADYTGIEYSGITNRALGATVTSSTAPLTYSYADIVDGKEPDSLNEEHTGMVMSVGEPVFTIMHSFGNEVQFPSGLQWVMVDLGKTYMIGHVVIMHSFHKNRIYHNTKTQVSEDGVNWTTVFDSAVSGEYREYMMMDTDTMYGNHIMFSQRPVRYIRDYANGYTEFTKDATTGDWITPVEHTENYWTEIKAYGDWEFDTQYVDADGNSMAHNGKGLVSTDIGGAWASIDIPIDFTSKWYMTYLIGPDFGMADVEMSSMMGMTHSLIQDAPVLSKFQHKHIMFWPPSNNVKADPMMNVKAGMHRATIRQKSGRINIDRFRFEDYQYFDRNSQLVTADKSATFKRTKVVPTLAQWYEGDAIQSSEGAYDTPRLNPDTGLPDFSVPIKYRMRFRVDLAAGATLPDGSRKPGKGIAYATSAIFETGKLSSHWRMSQSADFIPGTRIESWDGSHPHKTGIQNFHLANGAVNGNKIKPLSIMDHHINPYAKINESKLLLNYPTHRHGQPIMAEAMPGMMMEVGFASNLDTLDSITGWGTSGTSTKMARDDHDHNDKYVQIGMDSSVANLTVSGSITVSGNVDGVDVSAFKSAYDTHAADTTAHLTSAEHTKLTGISTGANKVTLNVAGDGKIQIDGIVSTVYAHPTGAGNNHIPTGGASGNYLKYSASGTATWANVSWTDVTSKPTTFTPPTATSSVLGGIIVGTGLSIDGTGTVTWTHPTGAGNNHIPTGGASGNTLKWSSSGVATWGSVAWTEISSKPTTFTPSAHQHAASDITDLNTVLSNYATKSDLATAGSIKPDTVNTFTSQNIFTKADGPAIVIKPSAAPAANTVLFQMLTTSGSNLVTMDAEGDVVINANLTVQGTTTYNGTNTVDGNYDVTGNLTVGGNTTLGDSATDQATIKGDLRLEGNFQQVGKYVEVHRRPLFGIAGDLQFQTDSIVFEDFGGVNYNPTIYGTPAVASGATRYYRIYVIYSDDITGTQTSSGQKSTLRILGYSDNTKYKDLDLGSTWGDPNMRRDWYSGYFTDMPDQHIQLQAKLVQAGNNLGIRWVEMIAYDKY